jgi:predicted nucleotidyltransferase
MRTSVRVEPARSIDGQKLIEEITCRLAAAAPGATVILFGSRSRGEERPDSDIDLLVIQPGEVPKPRAESARLRRKLRGFGVGIDLILVSRQYAEDWGHFEGTVLNEALSTGRVLIEGLRA